MQSDSPQTNMYINWHADLHAHLCLYCLQCQNQHWNLLLQQLLPPRLHFHLRLQLLVLRLLLLQLHFHLMCLRLMPLLPQRQPLQLHLHLQRQLWLLLRLLLLLLPLPYLKDDNRFIEQATQGRTRQVPTTPSRSFRTAT